MVLELGKVGLIEIFREMMIDIIDFKTQVRCQSVQSSIVLTSD